MTQLIKTNPRIGWVRANRVSSEALLEEINSLRKENQTLKEQIPMIEESKEVNIGTKNIAFAEKTKIFGTYKSSYSNVERQWREEISWKSLFAVVSPYLLQWFNEDSVQRVIATIVLKKQGHSSFSDEKLDKDILQTLKVQFLALGLIQVNALNTVGGGVGLFWGLTQKGRQTMLRDRSIKK